MKNEIKKEIDFINQKLKEMKKMDAVVLSYITLVPFSFLIFIVLIICNGG
jgi:hypothetical protein